MEDGVAPDLATGTDVEEPKREDFRVDYGETVRGLDTWNTQDRAGIYDRAARPPADHRDVGVTQDQHPGIAGRPEAVDGRRKQPESRDVLGVAGGQGGKELPGIVAQYGRLPALASEHLTPLGSPAIVVTPDAGDRPVAEQADGGIGLVPVAD